MKYFSALLFALVFFVSPVRADYNSAYTDYTYNYTKYRESYNAYQIAKSTYTTYKTLTAQADAIKKLKTVIQDRDNVMSSYYDLLQEKLLSTPGITADAKSTFYTMKESEKKWLIDHQKKIEAASSLEDLNTTSSQFLEHYPQMDFETKQVIGTILLTKESALTTRYDTSVDDVSNKLREISLAGETTNVGDRAVISSKNKKEVSLTKISAAQAILTGKEGSRIDLFSGQQKLSEANLYLREAVSYLMEIVRNITG